MRRLRWTVFIIGLVLSKSPYASYIETTMGTAVVNDATAAYFNPAALVQLKNPQFIPLESTARFETKFSGSTRAVNTSFTQSGTSNSTSYYHSPSFYLGVPLNKYMTVGFAAVTNYANRNPEENGLLRYIQSSNSIQDYDFVPSFGIRVNDIFSVGAGLNYSYTSFDLHPLLGFPGSNIPDSLGHNQSSGSGYGANAGFLLKPKEGTLIGFNYRTITTYRQTGTSEISGEIPVVSNKYHYTLRTPARSILSLSQKLSAQFGMIFTLQRIQWSIIQNTNIYNIAALIGNTPVIINASSPQHLRNTWLLTLGGNYRFMPAWIVRVAGTYNQSPHNGYYQLSTGDSYTIGTSVGYQATKFIIIDVGYAHAFMQDQLININGNRFIINGHNQGSRDVLSLKFTLDI